MKKQLLAIDYGDKKLGLAIADNKIRIPIPQGVIYNDQQMITNLLEIIEREKIDIIVVGYPRNQAGQSTAQTVKVESFVQTLAEYFEPIVWQDESLTSVLAEERLQKHRKSYTKEDIDAQAAAIILEDYLRAN